MRRRAVLAALVALPFARSVESRRWEYGGDAGFSVDGVFFDVNVFAHRRIFATVTGPTAVRVATPNPSSGRWTVRDDGFGFGWTVEFVAAAESSVEVVVPAAARLRVRATLFSKAAPSDQARGRTNTPIVLGS